MSRAFSNLLRRFLYWLARRYPPDTGFQDSATIGDWPELTKPGKLEQPCTPRSPPQS